MEGTQNKKAVAGGYSARSWSHFTRTFRGITAGFRPVLEPLDPTPIRLEDLVGKRITVYGLPGLAVSGKLVGWDDYDVVLVDPSRTPNTAWVTKAGEKLIVNRSGIEWLREDW